MLNSAYRALQNPRLFNTTLYKQAAIAVAAGFAIRIIIAIPSLLVRVLLFFVGFIIDVGSSQWDQRMLSGLTFIEKSVLQLPFFMMSAMRFVSPAMDEMFVLLDAAKRAIRLISAKQVHEVTRMG